MSFTIADALTVSPLSYGRLVAGSQGSANEIKTVDVLEVNPLDVPLLDQFWQPQNLAISSLYSVMDSVEDQINVIRIIHRCGLSGLVLCHIGIVMKELDQRLIDACDEIMLKVERPKGLIAYDTDAAVEARAAGKPAIYRLIRPRTIFYAVAFAAVSCLMVWGLATRPTLDLHVLRDRNPVFVRLHDGAVRNGYTVKIANRTFYPQTYSVRFDGPAGVILKTPGLEAAGDTVAVTVPANEVRSVRVFATLPPKALTAANLPAAFVVQGGKAEARAKTTFLSGAANAE